MTDIEACVARIDICTLKAWHLRLLDNKDWDGYAALLTDDFVLDLSAAANRPAINGRAAAVDWIRNALSSVVSVHHAHTPEFDFTGDDDAKVIWALQDRLVRSADQPSYAGFNQHHDRWVRRDGAWKLASHSLVRLHTDTFPPVRTS